MACNAKCNHDTGHVLCTSMNFIVNNNCEYYNHRDGFYRRKTRRGCKGGRRKHRKQQQIRVVSSSRRYVYHENERTQNSDNLIHIKCVEDKKRDKSFLIGYINAQSVVNKVEDIKDLVVDKHLDLMCISETWLKDRGSESVLINLAPPTYKVKSYPRLNRVGGGIAFIYKDNLHCSCRRIEENYTAFEAAQITIQKQSASINVFCVYRPPRNDVAKINSSTAVSEVEAFLSNVCLKSSNFIVVGDFNFHVDSQRATDANRLKSTLEQLELRQWLRGPTHKAGHTLDLLVTSKTFKYIKDVSIIDLVISDHFFVLCELNTEKEQQIKRPKKKVTTRKTNTLNIDSFKSDLTSILTNTPIENIDNLNQALENTLDSHAPRTTRTIPQRQHAPWFCEDILVAKKKRRAAGESMA